MYGRSAAVFSPLPEPVSADDKLSSAVTPAVPHRIAASVMCSGDDKQEPEAPAFKARN